MDRETLYELRTIVALHPYFQTARLLMLQNLFILHDPTFSEELKRSAIHITDRSTLFNLVEAPHYNLPKAETTPAKQEPTPQKEIVVEQPLAPTSDYTAYLNQMADDPEAPRMKGQDLIDSFLHSPKVPKDNVMSDTPPIQQVQDTATEDESESYFTETLARIYIKQGKYAKALQIIKRLSLAVPKKNAYFADQIRFLEKLINNNNKQ